MERRKQIIIRAGIPLGLILWMVLACGLPPIGIDKTNDSGYGYGIEQTAEALATSVIGTQSSLSAESLPTMAEVIGEAAGTALPALESIAGVPSLVPQQILTQLSAGMEQLPLANQESTEISDEKGVSPDAGNEDTPQEPGVAKALLQDSKNDEGEDLRKAAPQSENYEACLFERPFTQNNSIYQPDVDIVKAELSSDGLYYYFSIYLNGVNPSTQALEADYGIELDTDRDGRGDFLVWTSPPRDSQWSTRPISVYTDANNDVGAETALVSDAPSHGNGYEALLFSYEYNSDPHLAWSRVSPSDAQIIQIAFKPALLDNHKSFLWSVWADKYVRDPTKFDYNDLYTAEQAGSPMEYDPNFPVASLYSLDNTCRMGFGTTMTGNEPGICRPTENDTKIIPTIEIPSIPIPDLPFIP